MKLFVPGRICLFGEHTDWAGGYRRINADLGKGYTLIAGTNQGVYAEVKPHPAKLVVRSTLSDGALQGPLEIPMVREALLAEAERGGFFSYAAGVAYQILTHYRVRGLEIDNYLTDLPVKKGLSSSAAFCVLIARAFNRIYDLKMTVRGEMEFAYSGEITTPSRCGRMDQGCAYGGRPILMTFDGDRIDIEELKVPRSLYFVIADLGAGKDTKEILSKLNRCYPFAENDLQRGVQKYLGEVSAEITHEAARALESGDAERIGELMRKAQAEFDQRLQPACPSELRRSRSCSPTRTTRCSSRWRSRGAPMRSSPATGRTSRTRAASASCRPPISRGTSRRSDNDRRRAGRGRGAEAKVRAV